MSGEVHPYNFSYIAQENGEEKTKQFVADPSFVAGKPTVQRDAIPTYFVYEPCAASEEEENGAVNSTDVDPAFIAGKKTVTADRHPSNFAWDPYVATATDSEDAAAAAVNTHEESLANKAAPSPPAGISTRAGGASAGVYPYYYAWTEQQAPPMPPPPAVVLKHQGVPADAPSHPHPSHEDHAHGPGPAVESEECFGNDYDDGNDEALPPDSCMPVLRPSSVDPTLPTSETRAKGEAAKKKTRKAGAAVNTSMTSSASSQVHLHHRTS